MNSNISVTGNIGKDPEIKFSQAGNGVTSISVAVTPRYKNGDTWEDKDTIWFKAVFFGAKAEKVVDQFGKGNRVKVTGQLQVGQPWTDKGGVHHPGGWEIGNAEIELSPWEKSGEKSESTPAPSTPPVTTAQDSVAPF